MNDNQTNRPVAGLPITPKEAVAQQFVVSRLAALTEHVSAEEFDAWEREAAGASRS